MASPLPNDEYRSRANWIGRYLAVERKFDDKLKLVLTDALSGIDEAFDKLGDKFSDEVRRTQLSQSNRSLRSVIGGLFQNTGNLIRGYRTDAALAAVDAGLYEQSSILARIFPNPLARQAYAESLRATGVRNIESTITRVLETEKPLSARVYKTAALANGQVSQTVNRALARGDSAKELAKNVRALIDPNVPGGVSYAAMRLGRTELNNAFHAQSIHDAQEAPWVQQMRWHLSKVHEPQGCVCEKYYQIGLFPIDSVPEKPHPNCRCYVTPELPAYDNFENSLLSGQYDNYLDDLLGVEQPYSARELTPEAKARIDAALAKAKAKTEAAQATKRESEKEAEKGYAAARARQKAEKEAKAIAIAKKAAERQRLLEEAAKDVTIPETISEAKTVRQVSNFLLDKYDGLEIQDFTNDIPLESVKEVAQTFEDMFSLYPDNALKRLRVGKDTDKGRAITKAIGGSNKNGLEIVFHPDYFLQPYAKAKQIREDDEKAGWFIRGSGKPWESTFVHEWGHVIDFSSGAQISRDVDLKKFIQATGRKDAKVTNFWMDAFEFADDNDGSITYEDWVKSHIPSEYAEADGDEMVAESFAAYTFGTNRNRIVKEVFDNLIRTYKKREAANKRIFIKLRKKL